MLLRPLRLLLMEICRNQYFGLDAKEAELE